MIGKHMTIHYPQPSAAKIYIYIGIYSPLPTYLTYIKNTTPATPLQRTHTHMLNIHIYKHINGNREANEDTPIPTYRDATFNSQENTGTMPPSTQGNILLQHHIHARTTHHMGTTLYSQHNYKAHITKPLCKGIHHSAIKLHTHTYYKHHTPLPTIIHFHHKT